MTDLWRFQRWAREQKLGNPTRKLILTSLAITAEAQTGSGFMSQADLAEYAECSTRTVSDHLKALEAGGWIARRRRFSKAGRRIADGFVLLMPDVTEWPDGDPIEGRKPEADDDMAGVYVLLDEEGERVKIGHTSNPIAARRRQLSHILGRPLRFIAKTGDSRADEALLHARFADAMSDTGEWFALEDDVFAWLTEIDTTGTFRKWQEVATSEPAQSPPEAQASGQEQPIEKPRTNTEEAPAPAPDPRLSLPDDFPDALRSHYDRVLPILESVAAQHDAKKVWPLQLGKLMVQFQHRGLVAAAHELDQWAVDPPRPIKDVVGTYRTFLGHKRELQGIEQLNGAGNGRHAAGASATVGRTTDPSRPSYDAGIIWSDGRNSH